MRNLTSAVRSLVVVWISLFAVVAESSSQTASDRDISRGKVMLNAIKNDLKKHYYDPGFRGIDVDAKFKEAEAKITQATSFGQILGIIAQTLTDFRDSHLYLNPPSRPYRLEYGWQVQMVGNTPYVVAVKPQSDAAAKGVRPGDRVVSVDGIVLARDNLWVFKYLYHALRPQPGVRLEVMRPDGTTRAVDVSARVQQEKRVVDLTSDELYDLVRQAENEDRLRRHRVQELGDFAVWKMPQFDLPPGQVDDLVGRFRRRKGLILDLRGNGGGYEETMLRLIGNLFDREIKVGDLKGRKEAKSIVARSRRANAFTGRLIVLIDSESGSAAEVLARVVQLERRGTVVGDTSAGAVMRARTYNHQLGLDTVIPYGVTITDADIIMTDGKSLEHVGVVPDEIKLPTATDLAANRDPVLAHAAFLLGVTLSAEEAGRLFPIEWRD